jgi:hypothetical protein
MFIFSFFTLVRVIRKVYNILIRVGGDNMDKLEKKAIRKLKKEFEKLSQENQDQAAFYIDRQDDKHYVWDFEIENRRFEWIYVYETGIIVKCTK